MVCQAGCSHRLRLDHMVKCAYFLCTTLHVFLFLRNAIFHKKLHSARGFTSCLPLREAVPGTIESALIAEAGRGTGWRHPHSFSQIESALMAEAGRGTGWRHPQKHSTTLMSIHTANSQWSVTERMLVSLAGCRDAFDVVLVDDKSVRVNIPARARELGVFTIDFDGREAKGLTHSWNVAWRFFVENAHYKYLILANNDILVPDGVITKLVDALVNENWGWLLPVVSARGSENLNHRLHEFYRYPSSASKAGNVWTDSALKYQLVQDILDGGVQRNSSSNQRGARPVKAVTIPNGYMMALRKSRMMHLELAPGTLFDPKFKNIENDDDLGKRARRNEVQVGVHYGAFVHHHKGFTCFKSKLGKGKGRDAVGESNYMTSD